MLLADEPVSMLDVSIRLGVLNLLGDLRERDRLGILYITHDIASARYLADVIMVMYAGEVVESGPASVVTDEPAHPYTQLLLSAAPDPDRAEPPSLQGRGSPPSLVAPPSGCRFHPRCPHAMAVCAARTPPSATGGSRSLQRLLAACQRADHGGEPAAEYCAGRPSRRIHPVPQQKGERSRDAPGCRLAAATTQRVPT